MAISDTRLALEEGAVHREADLAEAIRAGLIAAPRGPARGVPDRLPVARFARLMRELEEDRARR
jgi:hypothetical protein